MPKLPSSELILNERGAVYHLDLLPEEIATQIILVGDPDRVSAVSKHFDRIDLRRQTREFITHTGSIGKNSISVISTGIGTDNIDIVLNELDALVNIDLQSRQVKQNLTSLQFIRIGTSGALQEDVPVNSILVSSHGLGLDNLMNFYAYSENEADAKILSAFNHNMLLIEGFSRPYLVAGSSRLADLFPYQRGITATCPGFYGPQGRVLRAPLAMPDMINQLQGFNYMNHRITNFEMETAGIYGMSRILGHEAVSLNAILANRVTGQFSEDPKAVVEVLIEKTLSTIVNSI